MMHPNLASTIDVEIMVEIKLSVNLIDNLTKVFVDVNCLQDFSNELFESIEVSRAIFSLVVYMMFCKILIKMV